LPPEKSEEMHGLIGSIPAHVFNLESIASSNCEGLLRQRL
jgi:hypothetical protein